MAGNRVEAKETDVVLLGCAPPQVGEEWRNLEDEKKRGYEEKAKEAQAKAEAEGRIPPKKAKRKKKETFEDSSLSSSCGPSTPQQLAG